jgi:TonB-dependent SusC/RagA subfamily outer membrane receptor
VTLDVMKIRIILPWARAAGGATAGAVSIQVAARRVRSRHASRGAHMVSPRRLRTNARLIPGMVLLAGLAGAAGCQSSRPDTPTPGRTADRLEREHFDSSATSMLELLQGQFPGVLVRQRGSDISVQIRGPRSFSGSNEALILVDGIEVPGRTLSVLSPSEVQRVEVIRDGAAAMYGVRGANGVLLITTRRD